MGDPSLICPPHLWLRHSFWIWLLTTCCLPAQGQIAYWQQFLGGSGFDAGKKVLYLPDGTLLLGIETASRDGLGASNRSDDLDVVIVKYASQGKTFWTTTIGGSGRDELADLIQTSDGGYLCVGTSDSRDGDFSVNHGGTDVWVAKLSPGGRLVWLRSLGGSGQDYGWSVVQDMDGGILIAAESGSVDGDMQSLHHGGLDGWIAKLSPAGRLLREKHFGGPGNDRIGRIHPHSDGLWLVGSHDAMGGDVLKNQGNKDLWMLHLDEDWNILRQQSIGGPGNDDTHDSMIDDEGCLVLAGTTFSESGDVPDQHGKGDGWLVKFDSKGNYLWNRAYGGTRNEGFSAITLTHDGGYAMVGMTLSENGHLSQNEGYFDGWFLKTQRDGAPQFSRSIGYPAKDAFFDVQELPQGGFIMIGHVQEKQPEKIFIKGHLGIYDVWLANLGDPARGMSVRPYRTPPIMIGNVVDRQGGQALESAITLTDNRTLDSLTATNSDVVDGSFVLLLPSYGLVSINVLAQGYLFYGQDILTDSLFDKTSIQRTVRLDPIEVGSSLVLENIYFQTGKWEILQPSFPELNRLIAFLELNPRVKIEISGHTDNTGNREEKIELSLHRAEAVKEYLASQGISTYRMSVKGYGMYRPRATNGTEDGRRLNRRVEFTVTAM